MNGWLLSHETGRFASALHINSGITLGLFVLVAIWSLTWKGVALWYAARNHQKKWFIVLLVLNTLGILEIIYILWFRRDKREGVTQSMFNNPLPDESDDEAASSAA
jgi:methionyl-tRNA synthetase